MSSEPEQVDSVSVIGGGDVGLLTALALQRGTDADVDVIDDFDETIPEVGKSTIYSVVPFLRDSLGIDQARLVEEVKLSWKTTVYFEDWCGVGPFHSPLGEAIPVIRDYRDVSAGQFNLTPESEAMFQELYYRYQEDNFTGLYGTVAETAGKTPVVISADIDGTELGLESVSYQFNSRSFNKFLRKLCRERGVELVDDRITDVETSGDRIVSVASDRRSYDADLYVDASGFKRVLMSELDNPLMEFDLPLDSAVVSTVEIPLSDINSATVINSGDAGWFWQIDTMDTETGNRDLGYVYSSSHISDEAAKREFIESHDEEIDPDELRWYGFDSGVLAAPWLENCVAMGNAQGFVEPLQSTALTTACVLANRLSKLLGANGRINHRGVRRLFNETALETWEENYDFISIHYKYNSGTTEFWEDARSIHPEPTEQYEYYQENGFGGWRDVIHLTRTGTDLNSPYLYNIILASLGVESEFYESLDLDVDQEVADQVDEYTENLSEEIERFLGYEELLHSFHPGYD